MKDRPRFENELKLNVNGMNESMVESSSPRRLVERLASLPSPSTFWTFVDSSQNKEFVGSSKLMLKDEDEKQNESDHEMSSECDENRNVEYSENSEQKEKRKLERSSRDMKKNKKSKVDCILRMEATCEKSRMNVEKLEKQLKFVTEKSKLRQLKNRLAAERSRMIQRERTRCLVFENDKRTQCVNQLERENTELKKQLDRLQQIVKR